MKNKTIKTLLAAELTVSFLLGYGITTKMPHTLQELTEHTTEYLQFDDSNKYRPHRYSLKTPISRHRQEKYTQSDVITISKLLYGEYRGFSKTEQSMVVWCVLNRVDAGYGTIQQVCKNRSHFVGYNPNNPVVDYLQETVIDVLNRWDHSGQEVGRTLPQEYCWFVGDNQHNYFTNRWKSRNYYTWPENTPYDT